MPSIYQNTVCNLTVQIWFRYKPPYRISASIEGTTLKITKIHATYNDYSCPLIDTSEVTSWIECRLKSRYIGSQGRYGKAIRGFPGHLSGSGRQLPVINIEIRFIVQDHFKTNQTNR